jgi:hypothetical protein
MMRIFVIILRFAFQTRQSSTIREMSAQAGTTKGCWPAAATANLPRLYATASNTGSQLAICALSRAVAASKVAGQLLLAVLLQTAIVAAAAVAGLDKITRRCDRTHRNDNCGCELASVNIASLPSALAE